ncbi:hypothetical protein [Desulfobacter latus]|uniref:Uncharacterized protein n=1 Tax=Desulfobacter latus TaxID=2292 RepID=A0A850T2E1_9BACT|nr:hypothetical protein [Desulfobacter latus]NWH05271.1 hypothetical protein [Desulfobacter latus]
MNSDGHEQIDVMDFACRFFKSRGGVVEDQGLVRDILLPEETAQSLGMDEFFRVGPEAVAAAGRPTVHAVQLHTPLLDRILTLAGQSAPFARAELKFDYIKTQGFDRLIKERFQFHKSKIQVMKTGEARTRYLILTCRYTAQSDEIKQGLVEICINLDTGVVIPDMSRNLFHVQKAFSVKHAKGLNEKEIEGMRTVVSRYGQDLVKDRLASFVDSMNRRFQRDTASLDAYYQALEKEMRQNLNRSGLSQDLIREREEKIAMIPAELAAKKKDLLNKYGIRIDFKPAAALYLTSACVTVFVRLISGRSHTDFSMTYNPVTKDMDPVACRACGAGTYDIGLSPNGQINCPDCFGLPVTEQ